MKKEEQQLLEQGIKDYVDALNAINTFRSLVQKECRRVVEDNLENYTAALGIDLSKKKIVDYEWSDGSHFSLGVKCIFRGGVNTQFGHSVWWDPTERGGLETGIAMSVWSTRGSIEGLKEVLRKKAVLHDGEARTVYLYEEMPAEDVNNIDTKLDTLMEGWINLWRKAGGIKALTGKSP